ncbi:MAG: hypothetical protein FGF50_11910, partial [Candidatus Brockarchaeota archaeon]|nr:hypothetical protein [Candidatus Brockarchaeota archaeon]
SPIVVVPPETDDLLRNYLRYACRSSPKSGFSCCSHFLHTIASTKYLLKVTKTICLVHEVDGVTDIHILGRVIKARRASLLMLVEKDNNFSLSEISSLAPEDVLAQLGKEELRERFLNAMLLEVRKKSFT